MCQRPVPCLTSRAYTAAEIALQRRCASTGRSVAANQCRPLHSFRAGRYCWLTPRLEELGDRRGASTGLHNTRARERGRRCHRHVGRPCRRRAHRARGAAPIDGSALVLNRQGQPATLTVWAADRAREHRTRWRRRPRTSRRTPVASQTAGLTSLPRVVATAGPANRNRTVRRCCSTHNSTTG